MPIVLGHGPSNAGCSACVKVIPQSVVILSIIFTKPAGAFCVKYGRGIGDFDCEIAEVSPIKKLCAKKNS
jgi:hypothetical protein